MSTLAAMKGRLGRTEYYTFVMKAGELVGRVKIPKDVPGWTNLSFDERYQREINTRRVKEHIAPYFANDPDRFFGALIVAAIPSGEEPPFHYRPLVDEIGKKELHPSYQEAGRNIGFLTVPGSTTLVPLDGQHRLKAIDFAIKGLDSHDKAIDGIRKANTELANEDVAVIMILSDPQHSPQARKIFTKVNLHARKPTRGETIATDDDDYSAVLARQTADRIGARLVRIEGSTLPKKAIEFTTLTILQVCNRKIVEATFPGGKNLDTTRLPDDTTMDMFRERVDEVWSRLLSDIDVFRQCLEDSENEDGGDARRQMIRKDNLLGRPVGQECLVTAYLRLIADPTNMAEDRACRMLNQLPWALTEENVNGVWQNVLWTGGMKGKVITGTKARDVGSRLISYMAGEELDATRTSELRERYRELFAESDRERRELPAVVTTGS